MMRCAMIAILALGAVQAEPAGTPAQKVHYRVARGFDKPESVDLDTLAAARSSPIFGARYAAALLQLHKALAKGNDFEEAWRVLSTLATQGGPEGAGEHLKSLAAALKDAVVCKACSSGRITCVRCKGTRKIDLPCPTCKGTGRYRREGDGAGSDMMCPKCNGKQMFKPFPCPDCHETGTTRCDACRGRPWFDKCLQAGCEAGKVPCPTCGGGGVATEDCSVCGGKGRLPTKNAGFTIRCDACNQTGKQQRNCKACAKTGRLPCVGCGGTGRGAKTDLDVATIFTSEPCGACGGKGWPDPEKAVACATCVGLGVRIKPAGAQGKLLE